MPAGYGRRETTTAEVVFEDFNRDSFDGWFVTGDAFGDRPSRRGRSSLELERATAAADRDQRRAWRTAAWSRTGCRACCARGPSRSRSRYIHCLVAGRGGRINVVVDGFEKIRDRSTAG